jgi:hypothetical protein
MVAAGNAWQTTRGEGFCLIRLGASSPGNLQRVVELGGSMHRSLHRRGQLLVLGLRCSGPSLVVPWAWSWSMPERAQRARRRGLDAGVLKTMHWVPRAQSGHQALVELAAGW